MLVDAADALAVFGDGPDDKGLAIEAFLFSCQCDGKRVFRKTVKAVFKSGWWWLSLVLVLLGIGASLYLTVQHFTILKSGVSGETFCNINPYLNCDIILLSNYSEIGTLPLAGLGLLFYIYLLGALIYVRIDGDSASRVLTLPYLGIIASCILSFFLAYVSMVRIQALCIFCTSLYFINLFLFVSVKKVIGMNFRDWIAGFKQVPWLKGLSYLFIVFIVGSIIFHTSHKQYAKDLSQHQLGQLLTAFFRQPVQEIDVSNRPFWGKPDGSVVVVEFSDFECPYCKRAALTLKPLLAQYRDRVKLVFMNYPLDSGCNKNMQRSLHRYACNTAYAAHCAGQQGKFWEYHDMAFSRQPKFQEKSLENMAEKLKLNMAEFRQCLTAEKTKSFIVEDIDSGNRLNIRGTPAVYVNGRPFPAWMSKNAWRELMEKLESEPVKAESK
jgi:protein-disulfide isomerase/uncharacterized membrane protein